MNDNDDNDYKSGTELIAQFDLPTREAKLEKAVICLMSALEELHVEYEEQSLAENLTNTEIFCSCADAYRIGTEALKP